MMNSLKLSLDLFKSVTAYWAGVSSKGGQPVTPPLARPSVFKLGAGPKRKENPLACFQTEIYASMVQQPEYQADTSAAGAAAGDQEMQEAGQEQAAFPGLDCWLPTPANKVLKEEAMREAYHALIDARSPLNTLDQMTVADMCRANADHANDRLAILPDFKRQRQMPHRRRMRLRIITGTARDDNTTLTFLFINPQLRMEQADVIWQTLSKIPNIWELDQPLQNPEYYKGCWLYDFHRLAQYQAEVPIPDISFENSVQETLQNSIAFRVPIGPTKMIPLYDVNIHRVVYLTQALYHQLEMAAKMTADLVDEPRGGPRIFTYMVGAEEAHVPLYDRSLPSDTWPACTWQWTTRPLKLLYRVDLKTLQEYVSAANCGQ
ncbi:hypothetical protein CYMTET_16148 [Cymbomonas tetramitiformis]|uniref:Uncharacterized protein n=1 Tax=Cymbomonas tetramitiformis TaxID=36881 RepID=A0AAE0GCY4_9CHLO|nr:hypothetical protein CYMTET_16148 [Cymbomonas tetramitiformis]